MANLVTSQGNVQQTVVTVTISPDSALIAEAVTSSQGSARTTEVAKLLASSAVKPATWLVSARKKVVTSNQGCVQTTGAISLATSVARLVTWPNTALQEATVNATKPTTQLLAIDVANPGTWLANVASLTLAQTQETPDNKGTTAWKTEAQSIVTAVDKRVTSLGIAPPKRTTVRKGLATSVERLVIWPEIVLINPPLTTTTIGVVAGKTKASPAPKKTRMAVTAVVTAVVTVEETTNPPAIRFTRQESRTTGRNDTKRWTTGQDATKMVLTRPT